MRPLKFPVTIHANGLEGFSDYHLGHQLEAYLNDKGVETIYVEKFAKNLFGKAKGTHLVSFYTDLVWPLYRYARHGGPKTVTQLQCIGPKVYALQDYIAYLTTLCHKRMNGIPVAHLHVSPSTEHDTFELARKYFNPSMVGMIATNCKRNFYGIEEGFKVHKKPDVHSLVAPQNRWEEGQKNLPLHQHLSNLYKARCEMQGLTYEQVFYYNPKGFDPSQLPPPANEVYDFKVQYFDRAEFKQNIGKHGMFLSTSVRESFGLYFVELLKSGVVGVFQDYEWNRMLLPNYPFRGSGDELIPMMEWVRDNYAEARKMVRKATLPYIEKTYNEQVYLDGIYETMLGLEDRLAEKETTGHE